MESRLTDLEIRYAHQEATLEAVNETLLLQQRSIEALRAELERIKQQMRGLNSGEMASAAEETPPPHY
ncbi:Protein SlyX [hydrothermal vent metagenome]|uniref:Protein SlyX n=1 Tax=hydrothermal vent metagenome TaxID=652676 RepID=A0A3B0ZV17_9ZZZZ